jgi:hypothetical protein
MFHKNIIPLLCSLVALLLFAAGCSIKSEGVWYDIPDLSPREALLLAQDQEGPASFPPRDLVEGRGRVVQMGRRLVMLVEVLNDEGSVVDSGRVTCLYPALEPSRYDYLPCAVSSGKVPDYFFPTIAGMRRGGVRQVILPRTNMPPDSTKRFFIDAVSGNRLCEIPVDREVALRITVTEVRRPKIVIMTTYSVPAMRDRRVMELWSW